METTMNTRTYDLSPSQRDVLCVMVDRREAWTAPELAQRMPGMPIGRIVTALRGLEMFGLARCVARKYGAGVTGFVYALTLDGVALAAKELNDAGAPIVSPAA